MTVVGSVFAIILATLVPSDEWCNNRVRIPTQIPDAQLVVAEEEDQEEHENAEFVRETHNDVGDYTTWSGFDFIDE